MKHKKLEGASIQEMLLIKTSFCQNFMVDIIENSDLLKLIIHFFVILMWKNEHINLVIHLVL